MNRLSRCSFANAATLRLWLDGDADDESYFRFKDLQMRLEKLCAAANGMPSRGMTIQDFARVIAQQFQLSRLEQRQEMSALAGKAAETKLPDLMTTMRTKAAPVAGLTYTKGIDSGLFYERKVCC